MLAGTVVQTKLQRPPARARLVARAGLEDRFAAGLAGKLTVVSAPAGFGKTTAVSAWLAATDRPSGWLSLDEDDDDPRQFLACLALALQRAAPAVGDSVRAMLEAPRPPATEALLADLVNDLAALERPVMLVLDDLHRVRAPEIHAALAFLLEHQPRQLHLVVVGREDPMLPLPRLRARGELTEIRAEHLRFDADEAAAFLNERMGLDLDTAGIATLTARTEGWIAGLQLAALALEREPDRRGFIESFAGDDRYVTDFLVSEVLERQPPEIRAFLLETSILEPLSAPLCDAVRGRRDSRVLLERIDHANLFLVPLDHRREVYRYHHLFGEMLRVHLRESATAPRIADLHRRAGSWYRRQGAVDDAVHHLLRAPAPTEAAGVVEAAGLRLLSRGRLRTLLGWLQALPDEIVAVRPLLCVQHAWALNLTGRPEAMEARLTDAERALVASPPDDTDEERRLRGMIATIRAGAARKRHEPAEAIAQLRVALEQLPTDDRLLRASAHFNLGVSHLDLGELARADAALRIARAGSEVSEGTYTVLSALSYRADARALQGRLDDAESLYREAIELGARLERGRPHPLAGFAYAGLGRILYERNDLDAAEAQLLQAVALGERLGDQMMLQRGCAALARLRCAQGRSEEADELWHRTAQLASRFRDASGEALLEAERTELRLAGAASAGEVPAWPEVARWAEAYRRRDPDPRALREATAQRALARVEIVTGDPPAALARLARLEARARAGRHCDHLIRILLLTALAEADRGNAVRALAALAEALELGRPAGYLRTFLDHGTPLRSLLRRAARRSPAVRHANALLVAFGGAVGRGDALARSAPPGAPFEPVTERERQILRLMAAFRSNKEIARELGLSVNTVKWYSGVIYGKLGVHKRAEAAARARELELL